MFMRNSTHKTPLILLFLALLVLGGGFLLAKTMKGGTTTVINESAELQPQTPTSTSTATQTDAVYTVHADYKCADGKSFKASFGDMIARVAFEDEQSYTLELTGGDNDNGTKFSNEGDQMEFWVSDQNAFIKENGVETYSGCRAS